MQISSPRTIKSLWRMSLLDGTPDAHIVRQASTVWTNERGKALLADIYRDTGIYFDVSTDCLIYPDEDGSGNVAVH
jgi:hypothetical protein